MTDTTTRAGALAELIAKVEAGDATNDGAMFRAFGDRWTICFDAFHGSLDAAKALHDAVLPGADWCVAPNGASVYSSIDRKSFDADIDDPARAWLLAILRALAQQEGAKG